jgi:branched-chain amino acid transport system permease protein
MLTLIGQLIFDGMIQGLVFVILAAGLVFIVSTTRIFFIAYGQFYMVGAYAAWFLLSQANVPYLFALLIGIVATGILGFLCYFLIFQRIANNEARFLTTITAAMGLSLIIGQVAVLVFGSTARNIPQIFTGEITLLGINFAIYKLVLIGVGILVTLLLFWIYEKTSMGRAMRAVVFSPETATLMGINPNFINQFTFGLATLLAAFAGGLIAPSYGMSPGMGNTIFLSLLLMVMLGGMDSLLGAVVGGLIVGEILSFGQYFIGGFIQIILFIAIGIVIYFRPQGLMGHKVDMEN